MAYVPNRDDPFLPSPSIEDVRRRQDFDGDFQPDLKLQADPTFEEGPASRTRVGLYAVAVLAVLGALFYGLNAANNSSQTASDTPTSAAPSSMAQSMPPARNVTPGPNSAPGVTTGQAPSEPAPAK